MLFIAPYHIRKYRPIRFLRCSLGSLAHAYKLHVYDFFCYVGTFGGTSPPPPPYQKAGYATVASFRSPEEWPNEADRFRPPPPHSLHEIAATARSHSLPIISIKPFNTKFITLNILIRKQIIINIVS